MQPFNDLPRPEQADRLKTLAHDALTYYDLTPTNVTLVGFDTNAIYRVDTTSGETFALRITSPEADHTLDEIQTELAFLHYIKHHTDIHVPQPILTRDGALYVVATFHGVPEPRACTLFTWLEGNIIAEDITPTVYTQLGDVTARLHQAAAKWNQHVGARSEPSYLRKINRVFYFNDPLLIFQRGNDPDLYHAAADRVQSQLDSLWASAEQPIVIHADLNPWNVMWHNGTLAPFDFEDLMLGFPVQDIAISLYYIRTRPDAEELIAAFREGYSRHLSWPSQSDFELHFVHRALMLYNFCLTIREEEAAERIAMWLNATLPAWLND